jgi:hypothetical protein
MNSGRYFGSIFAH